MQACNWYDHCFLLSTVSSTSSSFSLKWLLTHLFSGSKCQFKDTETVLSPNHTVFQHTQTNSYRKLIWLTLHRATQTQIGKISCLFWSGATCSHCMQTFSSWLNENASFQALKLLLKLCNLPPYKLGPYWPDWSNILASICILPFFFFGTRWLMIIKIPTLK